MARRVRRQRGTSRVTSKHQVTIPVQALEQAGLVPGDRLVITADGPGRVVLERQSDVLADLAGALTGTWPADALDELRNEWT